MIGGDQFTAGGDFLGLAELGGRRILTRVALERQCLCETRKSSLEIKWKV
jgi:hypothetical protein